MRVRVGKRLCARLSVVVLLSLVVGLTALPAAQPAVPSAQECRGTLVLESWAVISDTDPNPPWTQPDKWTYHIYAWQNGTIASYQDYHVQGDTGYVQVVNRTIQSIPLGAPGDPVTLKLELWTKEKDPSTRPWGVHPADRGRIVVPKRTETCAPGEFRFSVFNDVPAQPAPPGPNEHNGRVEFRWKWTLEVV
jgi:hypothetical protein